MTLLIISLASWVVAVGTYVGISLLVGGRVSIGDTQSLSIWGGVMAAIAVPFVYQPIMSWLRRRACSWWAFPMVGGLLGAVPLMLFLMLWSGSPVAGIVSQGGLVLFTVFVAFGTSFGLGFRIWCADESA